MLATQPTLAIEQQPLARRHDRQIGLDITQLRITCGKAPATRRQAAGNLHHLTHPIPLNRSSQLRINLQMPLQQKLLNIQAKPDPRAPGDRTEQTMHKTPEASSKGRIRQLVSIPDITGVMGTRADMSAADAGTFRHG